MADWYYIGHYGQLGPLSLDQMGELIEGGVVERDTYVWRTGMATWLFARDVEDLKEQFRAADPYLAPPPPPAPVFTAQMTSPSGPVPFRSNANTGVWGYGAGQSAPVFHSLKSDRSRVLGGCLQFIPGVGRMYLGYGGYGALQLVLACFGIGIIWSWVDGLIILSGGMKLDGYGRELPD